jgi:hypothetical protein
MTEHREAVPAWWPDAAASQQHGLLVSQLDNPDRPRCLPHIRLFKQKRAAIHISDMASGSKQQQQRTRGEGGMIEKARANSLTVDFTGK